MFCRSIALVCKHEANLLADYLRAKPRPKPLEVLPKGSTVARQGATMALSHGNMHAFNTNDGFAEAIFRGFRLDILKPEDYSTITGQVDTLEGALAGYLKHTPSPRTPLRSREGRVAATPVTSLYLLCKPGVYCVGGRPKSASDPRQYGINLRAIYPHSCCTSTAAPYLLVFAAANALADLKQALQSMGSADSAYNWYPYGKDFLADKTSSKLEAKDFVEEVGSMNLCRVLPRHCACACVCVRACVRVSDVRVKRDLANA
jgi:hypothetical protein